METTAPMMRFDTSPAARQFTGRDRSLCLVTLLLGLYAGLTAEAVADAAGAADSGASPQRTSAQQPSRARIRAMIDQAARRHGVEPALVHAVVAAESAYNTGAVSSAGAIGLMQVMPATARDYGVTDHGALFDPKVNIDTGVRHLRRLLEKYRHDYGRVLMAYNAGEGAVDRTGSKVHYTETLDYMEAVARRYRQFGGAQSTAPILSKVSALRQRSRSGDRRRGSSAIHDDRLLPPASPRLSAGIPRTPFTSGSSFAAPKRASDYRPEGRLSAGLSPGVDPAIRDVARPASVRAPAAERSFAGRQR